MNTLRRRPLVLTLAALALAPLAACSKKEDEAAAPRAARKPSGIEAYAIAQRGHGFTVGAVMAANTVYVFFDTTCPHCAELWTASQPLLNRLKMVWMPIGLLRPQSGPQGATILAAADPAKAMTENETSVMARGGGISVPANLPDDIVQKVKDNTALFQQLQAESVPLIVYRHAVSGEHGMWHVRRRARQRRPGDAAGPVRRESRP
ncbi:DsbC family protein [Piscinibacter sp.]|uniref:DsbC family protein n=1 Tax=Piscinibacter sp. TaxID=1903157 RepID=UPI003783EB25